MNNTPHKTKILEAFLLPLLLLSAEPRVRAEGASFPYGMWPAEKPNIPLSAAVERLYDRYDAHTPAANELFTDRKSVV